MNPEYLTFGSRIYTKAGGSLPPVIRGTHRFSWDEELAEWGYKCRTQSDGWQGLNAPPAVLRHYPVMKNGAGDFRVNVSNWWDVYLEVNGGDVRKAEYIGYASAGQFNKLGFPYLSNVAFCGNEIQVVEDLGAWLKFRTLKASDVTHGLTFENAPALIHRFHCVKWEDGQTVHILSTGTARGAVYSPLITELGFAYILKANTKEL